MTNKIQQPATLAAQGLGWIDEVTRAVSPPLHASSTYIRDPDNQYRSGRDYIRADNPARSISRKPCSQRSKAARGRCSIPPAWRRRRVCFSRSNSGDHVVAPKVMYWGLRNWLMTYATGQGLQVELVEMSDLAAVNAAVRKHRTRLVWVESPANPLWGITDLAAVAEIAHKAGARVAADSTVATPVLTRPLELGIDLVMHSATKYLNGHSDIIAGALVTHADDEHWQRLKMLRAQMGAILGSFESWLLLRGMRTLYPRVKTACANAQALAERLPANPHVEEVLYPGLKDFPGHAIAAKQMSGGFGGMLSIRVKGGEQAAIDTAARVQVWKRAILARRHQKALIELPVPRSKARVRPCPPDLLRLSAGIEDAGDLIADLEQALEG